MATTNNHCDTLTPNPKGEHNSSSVNSIRASTTSLQTLQNMDNNATLPNSGNTKKHVHKRNNLGKTTKINNRIEDNLK